MSTGSQENKVTAGEIYLGTASVLPAFNLPVGQLCAVAKAIGLGRTIQDYDGTVYMGTVFMLWGCEPGVVSGIAAYRIPKRGPVSAVHGRERGS